LSEKQRQQKAVWNDGTAVPLEARAVPLEARAVPLEARAVPTSLVGGLHISVPNLHIFNLNQLQITFLFLQDEIFQIFVPEIK